MKGNMARTAQVVLFVTALCISMASSAKAESPACSLARAAGKYANSMSGTILGLPWAAVELATVDADGTFRSKLSTNWNGVTQHFTLDGTIAVNADCTGTASWKRHVGWNESGELGPLDGFGTLDMVADDDMQEIRFVLTSVTLANGDPVFQVVVKGEGRKVFPQSSDQQ